MTTITSNGHFLIADKRTTVVNSENSTSYGSVTKIVIPENSLAINGDKVLAYAISGNATIAYPIFKNSPTSDIIELGYFITKGIKSWGENHGFSLLAVLESGSNMELNFDFTANKNSWNCTVYEKGVVCSTGSGSTIIRNFHTADILKSFARAHILDIHLFQAAFDSGSSTDYDVYSLEENKLITDCRPTKQAVQESIDRVTQRLDFTYKG